ncbi:copper amine oxidase N-terminal domain-containing protein [Paenibacillus glycanilyticus]|uniref:copper amine oxidase N-terminal domain-containing protein n=1 Tax=Paenibacillus glycanilyticus TaxID=126569 RepID=UPI000FD8A779|nr:copper amine oxidase N-terminal domain-containing protein [Paenibacillus glycanilyticus]
MFKKLIGVMIVLSLVVSTPRVEGAPSVSKQIQLVVNNKQIAGVNPIVKSGVMYVPFRKFSDQMGYKVVYDPDTGIISANINGVVIRFGTGEDIIEYNDTGSYYLTNEILEIKGQAYIPLREFGDIAKYSIYYDEQRLTVSLQTYGYGQEAAIKELITKYFEAFTPKLLTSDNLTLGYQNPEYDYEANQVISEIPVRESKLSIDRIEYTAKDEATLQVTYIKNTEELKHENVNVFIIRYEQGQWKIAHDGWFYNKLELPEDIDQKAAAIIEDHFSEQNNVLSDLRKYYIAYNAEDLDQTIHYTAPSFIKEWEGIVIGSETWKDNLKGSFSHSDARYKLSNERVVFLGKKEAVVQGTLSWSDMTEGVAEGDDVFDALIYMENANGRWTYNYELDLDQDFDTREEIAVFD